MPAVELDAARLVGGSEADRSRVLERVHEYLEANASFDWGQLQDIWSGAPEAVFFNLNGHTYKGPRALDPAVAVLSTERQERLLDAIRPRRRRIERSRRRLVRTAHAVGMDRSGPAPTGAALRRFVHLALDDGVPQGSGRLARRARAFLGSEHGAASGRHLSARAGPECRRTFRGSACGCIKD